jgi:tRNA G18 (ribose-2'-O)-methylase SpoU
MHNVGSIFRTADAAGCEKIYICGITSAPLDKFGRKRQPIAKVSLNAEDYIPWEYTKSTTRLIDKLKKDGYTILAIEQSKESIPYFKFSLQSRRGQTSAKSKIALVLGNEIKGLPSSVLKRANKILEIPMLGKKESLNVAVAFGIAVFYLLNK